jgi:hypothetical protein
MVYNMGKLYETQGKLDEAEKMYQWALLLRIETYSRRQAESPNQDPCLSGNGHIRLRLTDMSG